MWPAESLETGLKPIVEIASPLQPTQAGVNALTRIATLPVRVANCGRGFPQGGNL